jgi:phosphoglycolate phosphatase
MFELVVWDLDGTLLDTAPDLYKAFCDMLKDFGFNGKDIPGYDEFRKYIGGGAFGFIQPFLPEELWEKALFKVRKYYLERYICKETRPYEGIVETLETLKDEGLKLAVATNKITEGAIRVLERTDLLKYFDLIVGRDLPKEHKPSPQHLFYITERLNVGPRWVLQIGDRSDDVVCAKRAGAKAGYALWGYTEPLELEPDFLLKNPKEVLNFVLSPETF